MAWVWERSPYRATQLLIHLALGDYANDDGFCYPRQAIIAKKSRCSRRYVRETLSDMKEQGFLSTTPRPGTSTIYQLQKPSTAVEDGNRGSDRVGSRGGTPVGTPAATNHHRTIIEPFATRSDANASEGEEEIEPDEVEYVEDMELQWSRENVGYQRPKWQTPDADMRRYMSPFKRKFFLNKDERRLCRQINILLKTKMITEEWVENVLSWATKPLDGKFGTRWSFAGFLRVVTDVEKYGDWQIRYDNAKRNGEDDSFDPTNLEHIQARYRPDN